MSRRVELRSPLKDKTLRNPGQSVENDISSALEVFTTDLVCILITGVMLLTAVLQWVFRIPPITLVIITAFYFVLSLAIFGPKMFKKLAEVKRLKRARDGERAVAEYLDLLRTEVSLN